MIGSIIKLMHWISKSISELRVNVFGQKQQPPALPARSSEHTLLDTVRTLGFDSCIAYIKSEPLTSLMQMAERLGKQEWILHTHLLIEAESACRVEWYARSLFIRHLHQDVPLERYFGMLGPSWAVDLALYRIALSLPRRYRVPCLRVALGYARADVSFTWKPQDPEDPAVVELFATYWPESSIAYFAPIVRLHSAKPTHWPDDDGGGDDGTLAQTCL